MRKIWLPLFWLILTQLCSKVKAFPNGPCIIPSVLEVVLTTPTTVVSDDNLDGDEIIYGHRSHGSIQCMIVQQLKMGSRRNRCQVTDPDTSNNEASSSIETGGDTVLLEVPKAGSASLPSSGPNSDGVRKVSRSNPRIEYSSSHSTRSHGMGFVSDCTGTSALNTGHSSRLCLHPIGIGPIGLLLYPPHLTTRLATWGRGSPSTLHCFAPMGDASDNIDVRLISHLSGGAPFLVFYFPILFYFSEPELHLSFCNCYGLFHSIFCHVFVTSRFHMLLAMVNNW